LNLILRFSSYKRVNQKSVIMLAILLALSALIHLWNPTGFPSVHIDESHYLRRAMIVLQGLGPQDPYYPYDHPYFGQVFWQVC
jgi:hypothetical protein